jgi:hypothetical protein
MKSTATFILALSFIIGAPCSHADVLLLDAIQEAPANNPDGLQRPTNGQSMDKVRSRFGDPVETKGAIGEPPITRWIYDNFTVYFEHDLVINTVVHRQ